LTFISYLCYLFTETNLSLSKNLNGNDKLQAYKRSDLNKQRAYSVSVLIFIFCLFSQLAISQNKTVWTGIDIGIRYESPVKEYSHTLLIPQIKTGIEYLQKIKFNCSIGFNYANFSNIANRQNDMTLNNFYQNFRISAELNYRLK
jgi:hypothetical protein